MSSILPQQLMGKIYLRNWKKFNFSAYVFDSKYTYLRTSLGDLLEYNQNFSPDLNSTANTHKHSTVEHTFPLLKSYHFISTHTSKVRLIISFSELFECFSANSLYSRYYVIRSHCVLKPSHGNLLQLQLMQRYSFRLHTITDRPQFFSNTGHIVFAVLEISYLSFLNCNNKMYLHIRQQNTAFWNRSHTKTLLILFRTFSVSLSFGDFKHFKEISIISSKHTMT